jgi:hypothetical protein
MRDGTGVSVFMIFPWFVDDNKMWQTLVLGNLAQKVTAEHSSIGATSHVVYS